MKRRQPQRPPPWRIPLLEFYSGEEVADFEGGGVFGVGAVDGVLADGGGELLADGSLFGLGGVGCAHELAEVCDGVVLLEDHGEDGAGGHECGELREEG